MAKRAKAGGAGSLGTPMAASASGDVTSASAAETVNIGGGDYTPSFNGGQARALWVGTAGNVKVNMVGTPGSAGVTFPNLTVGWHPIQFTKVYQTGTTASNMVACG